jgi:hypothetical protein
MFGIVMPFEFLALHEGFTAIWNLTDIRSLPSMTPQVNDQMMTFKKCLKALITLVQTQPLMVSLVFQKLLICVKCRRTRLTLKLFDSSVNPFVSF